MQARVEERPTQQRILDFFSFDILDYINKLFKNNLTSLKIKPGIKQGFLMANLLILKSRNRQLQLTNIEAIK